jgi:peptide/nickel transport system substrate-binding protein
MKMLLDLIRDSRNRLLAAGVLLLVFLLACGSSATEAPPTEAAPAATPVAATSTSAPVSGAAADTPVPQTQPTAEPATDASIKRGGIITMQKHVPMGKLDPHPSSTGIEASEFAPLYNQLVQYSELSPTNAIVEDLASNWEVNGDGTIYTFTIHDNVKFTDGEDLTSDDVVFSLNRMVEEGKPRPRAGLLRNYYQSSRALDPYTVEVTLKFPAAAFLPVLGIEYMKILPKHVVEAGVDITVGENVVGSGPFIFSRFVKGDRVEFAANPDYFKEGLPYVDGLTKFIIGDIGRMVAAFQTEQLHTQTIGWTNMTVVDYLKLDEDSSDILSVTQLNDYAAFGMMINTKVPPLDDVRVRRALFLATNGDALNEAIMASKGKRHGPVPFWVGLGRSYDELLETPGFRLTADGEKDPRDIEEAKQLLAEAGFPNGFDITMKFRQCCQYAEQTAMLKEQFKDIGVNLELIGMESVAGFAAYSAEDFELAVQGNGFAVPDADVIINALYRPEGVRNYSHWSHPKLEELYAQQSKATDPAERQRLITEIEEILLFEDSPWVGLYWQPFFWVKNHQIKNWDVPLTVASTGMKWEAAWIDD